MIEVAGNLPQKLNDFRHFGFKSSADNLSEERESENLQIVAEIDEVNTVVVGETSNTPAKIMSFLQNVPMSIENVTSGVLEKNHKLTVSEKDSVMRSSEEEMDDLNVFVNDKLQFMRKNGLEQLVGDRRMNVEEILCGSVAAVSGPNVGCVGNAGTKEIDQGRTT